MTRNRSATPYDNRFFRAQRQESTQAAEVVVPLLLELFPLTSVLDVGAGVGAWVAAFMDSGVADAVAVDGDYLDPMLLEIPRASFVAHDLREPLDLRRRFDLVLSLEVAEHLPPERARTFVETLTRHGDLIVFSAAVPGQGGTDHMNEAWPTYWSCLFARRGYEVFDVLRPRLWAERRVGFWFRQNILVFATGPAAERVRAIPSVAPPLDVVHPEQLESRIRVLSAPPGIRSAGFLLQKALMGRIDRELPRLARALRSVTVGRRT